MAVFTYMYLVENLSPYTAARGKAYKSTDSYIYFRFVWVVKDRKLFINKAKLHKADPLAVRFKVVIVSVPGQ